MAEPGFHKQHRPTFTENDKLGGLWCEEFQYEWRGGTEEIHIIAEGESQLNRRVHTLSLASAMVYQTLRLESERKGGNSRAEINLKITSEMRCRRKSNIKPHYCIFKGDSVALYPPFLSHFIPETTKPCAAEKVAHVKISK